MSFDGYAPLSRVLPFWPQDLLGDVPDWLSEVSVRNYDVQEAPGVFSASGKIEFGREVEVGLPGVEAISVAVLAENGQTVLPFELTLDPSFQLTIPNIAASLRVKSSLLKPVVRIDNRWVRAVDADGNPAKAELRVGGVSASFDFDSGLTLAFPTGAPAAELPPLELGDTGIVVEALGVTPVFSATATPPEGAPAGFRGLAVQQARVHLPPMFAVAVTPEELAFSGLRIGTGGFGGTITGSWSPSFDPATMRFAGAGSGTLGGVPFALRSVSLTFSQSVPTASSISGDLVLPFFDQPVTVDVSIAVDGALSVALSATQPSGVQESTGIIEFTKPGLMKVRVDGIGFSFENGVFAASISGAVTPLALGANAPSFGVRELSIDSQGHVRIEGGWLDLPSQYALNFYGFKLEITRVGFGKLEDGRKWVGLSGGLKLVDALPAGASVEGLRLIWDEAKLREAFANGTPTPEQLATAISVTLSGVGLEFRVPGVVEFKGSVSYSAPEGGKDVYSSAGVLLGKEYVHRFDGDISLSLPALGFEIDAVLSVGSAYGARGKYNFFAIYIGAELPVGIPLWSTGLALYGAAGLFALAMEPNKRADESWYGVGPSDGWYKRNTVGVTDLKNKWDPNPEALALGAGVTIGTVADNGFTFAGKVLLVIVLPGPIVMLEGKANMLKERASLDEEPVFRALAVLDGRAGNATVGLDVTYKNAEAGELIDIRGGVEAYYDFHDANAWHIYLGKKEPKDSRVRASIFNLFEADGYLMLDARALQTGAWVGVNREWTFGPLVANLEAWIEGNAVVSFKPPQFRGDLWLHGNIGASVFGFGCNLVADATCTADVFRPLHILFNLNISIDLPWFLPDIEDIDYQFEYGPISDPPPLALPLKELAIEHLKVSTKWPLKRGEYLHPSGYLFGDGYRALSDPTPVAATFLPADIPVVPLDGRPVLSFGRSMHDDAMVGVNGQPNLPNAEPKGWEWIGNASRPTKPGAARVRYALKRLVLEKHTGAGSQPWATVASTDAAPKLFGSWANVPQLPLGPLAPGAQPPLGQSKLTLWSKSAFDYARNTSGAWDEWFTDSHDDYPCVPPPSDTEICCGVDAIPVGTKLTSPWTCPDHPQVQLAWAGGAVGTVTELATPIDGHKRAICFPGTFPGTGGTPTPVAVTVVVPANAKQVDVLVKDSDGGPRAGDFAPPNEGSTTSRTCIPFDEQQPGAYADPYVLGGVTFDVPGVSECDVVESDWGPVLSIPKYLEITFPCDATGVELELVRGESGGGIAAYDGQNNEVELVDLGTEYGSPERIIFQSSGIKVLQLKVPADTLLLEACFTCPGSTVTCVDFDEPVEEGPNPLLREGVSFEVVGAPFTSVVSTDWATSLMFRERTLVISLPCEADTVTLQVAYSDQPFVARSYDAADNELEELTTVGDPKTSLEMQFSQRGIARIELDSPSDGEGFVSEVCYQCPGGASVEVPDNCIRFAERETSSESNPWQQADATFEAIEQATIEMVATDFGTALSCPKRLRVTFATPTRRVEVRLLYRNVAPALIALDAAGQPLTENAVTHPSGEPGVTSVSAPQIFGIELYSPEGDTYLLDLCRYETVRPQLSATSGGGGVTGSTRDEGAGAPAGGLSLSVAGTDLADVTIEGSSGFCIVGVCVTVPPEQVDVQRHLAMSQHMANELTRWTAQGDVLEPNTTYRLTVETSIEVQDWEFETVVPPLPASLAKPFNGTRNQKEYAFFRTEGPPGLAALSRPEGAIGDAFETGLEDLSRYVKETVPASVPPPGQKPILPAPIYRAYDVGVQFNEDYVDLMYRAARGDLGLYLYDVNGQPVRAADGRLLVPRNRWDKALSRTRSESEELWVAEVNSSDCATVNEATFPTDRTLDSAAQLLLDPTAIIEARLVPLLLAEDFSKGLSSWGTAIDQGTVDAPSAWSTQYRPSLEGTAATAAQAVVTLTGYTGAGTLSLSQVDNSRDVIILDSDTARASKQYRIVSVDNTNKKVTLDATPALSGGTSKWAIPAAGKLLQTSAISGGTTDAGDAVKPGTMLPVVGADWRDYRATVVMRNGGAGAVGVAFRVKDSTNYYRFSMDHGRGYRRLVRVLDGAHTVLAEDYEAPEPGSDHEVTVEAVGTSLRVYVDGVEALSASDASRETGGLALYAWGTESARFFDVRVDNFSPEPNQVAYQFKFRTSEFANFFHQLHSYDDVAWLRAADLTTSATKAVALAGLPTIAESADYDTAALAVLGQSSRQLPSQMEVTRVTHNGAATALLVRGSEPIDWGRTTLALSKASGPLTRPELPSDLKLVSALLGTTAPNDEVVTLLARESRDLSGVRVERRVMPASLAETGPRVLLYEAFDGVAGQLFAERFGASALDHYLIIDEEPISQGVTSSWQAGSTFLMQTEEYAGETMASWEPDKPGTLAITGDTEWKDVRLDFVLRTGEPTDIGVIFGFVDENNYYRLSFSNEENFRRLIRRIDGTVEVIWEDINRGHRADGAPERVTVFTDGTTITALLDGSLLFHLTDSAFRGGRAGFYSCNNSDSAFDALEASTLEAPVVSWRPNLLSLDEFAIVDEATSGPSLWAPDQNWLTEGALKQTNSVTGAPAGSPAGLFPGSYAIGGPDADDFYLAASLRMLWSGTIGLMFRVRDSKNYYRFAMDASRQFRRLVKVVNGTPTTLWDDATAPTLGHEHRVVISARGEELSVHVNDVQLCSVLDASHPNGRIAFYSENNPGAHFGRVHLLDVTRRVAGWAIHDEGTTNAPSAWLRVDGELRQRSAIAAGGSTALRGTQAVTGAQSWTDYLLAAELRTEGAGEVGLVFRRQNASNYYRLAFDATANTRTLTKRVAGVSQTLWTAAGGLPAGERVRVEVEAVGTRLRGYVGGVKAFDITDASLANGAIGLHTSSNDDARFFSVAVESPALSSRALFRDDLRGANSAAWTLTTLGTTGSANWVREGGGLVQKGSVHDLPIDRDTLAKEGTVAFQGVSAWANVAISARLRSSTGSAIGVVFNYVDADNFFRFSMDRVRGYRRLVTKVDGTYYLVWEDAQLYELNRTYEFSVAADDSGFVTGFLDGVPVFRVLGGPINGRFGLYSWNNTDARFSDVWVLPSSERFTQWELTERFTDSDNPPAWRAVDDGTVNAPSAWLLTDGLRQTSTINDGTTTATDIAKRGTHIVSDTDWDDFRMVVQMWSADPNALGVVFRYRDNDNYYRFSMDRTLGYRRLVKKTAGTFTLLWQDSVAFELSRNYLLTVDCDGEVLRGYLDGVPLFSVVDSDHRQGKVGAYSWKNASCVFNEFRIGLPIWAEHFTFAPGDWASAGERLAIYSGNASSAGSASWDLSRRFAAKLDDPGRFVLNPSAPLRVVEPSGTSAHARGFVGSSAYVSVPFKILRKADGTGFFVFPSSTSTLAAGEYRLRLEYRRDNSAALPGSIVLSQYGRTDKEVVELDIPWLARLS